MFPWIVVGLVIVTIAAVLVLRDAIADDRRRKAKSKSNYTRF